MFGKKREPGCPLYGGKPCLQEGCTFWIKLRGNHPQTGEPVDHFDCSWRWLPVLMIENTQQARQAGAAIESFRNEVARLNEVPVLKRPGSNGEAIPYRPYQMEP